jgi:hypothetical protein
VIDSRAARGHRSDHRYAQDAGEPIRIDRDAVGVGFVPHVEIEHESRASVCELRREEQRTSEVLGVGDLNDGARPGGEEQVAGHSLVVGLGEQAPQARRIHDGPLDAVDPKGASGDLDRGPRVVRDRYESAGQRREQ